jgi:hypothetical protein
MFEVCINYKDINISSIVMEDIKYIQQWLNEKNKLVYYGNDDYLATSEFNEIFLEYYVSESEIFLKILKANRLIGIFKGRIEFKSKNIIWISCFVLEYLYLDNNEGNIMLNEILEFFLQNYGITEFLIGVSVKEKKTLKLLKSNGFKLLRISNDFFMSQDTGSNAMIMQRNI